MKLEKEREQKLMNLYALNGAIDVTKRFINYMTLEDSGEDAETLQSALGAAH